MNRRIALYALILASVALFGCVDEGKITATSGQGVVSGQVVLSSELGGTPEGIRASVDGTGMSLVLGAEGHFLFAGVPSDATLRFVRVADGIDASIAVNGEGEQLVVELARSSARRARRAVRAQLDQYEGLVTELAADSITMDAAGKGEVVILVNEETEIRRANQLLTLEDLEVGWRVHVKAVADGESVRAIEIKVQKMNTDDGDDGGDDGNGDGPGAMKVEIQGEIVSVSATEITVDAAVWGPTTAIIDEDTVIRHGNKQLTPEDLKEGDQVHVKAERVGEDDLVARTIMLQRPA